MSLTKMIPGKKLVAITTSDSTDYSDDPFRAVWVGGAGNIAVIAENDTAAVTISGVQAGTLLPISVTKIMSTNTTATLIVGVR